MDLVDALENHGFQTFQAGNAIEAIALLEQEARIQVIFTDIHMPGHMDGIALAHSVRNCWPLIIIVVCSGNAHLAEKLPLNVTFLEKPVREIVLDHVLDEIAHLLAAH